MALGDSSTHLTSQDLEALENIQAELDRLTDSEEAITPNPATDAAATIVIPKVEPVEEPTSCSHAAAAVMVAKTELSSQVPLSSCQNSTGELKVHMLTLPNSTSKNVAVAVSSGEKVVLSDSVLMGLGKTHAPVYLVPSTSGLAGIPTTTMTVVSLSSLQNLTHASGPVTVQSPVSTELKTVQAVVKRPTLSHSGQVITKVIITSNPLHGQSGPQQVCIAPVQSVSGTQGNPTSTLGQPFKIVTAQPQGLLHSPTKTVNVSQSALLSSFNKQPILATIPGTPPKQLVNELSRICRGKNKSQQLQQMLPAGVYLPQEDTVVVARFVSIVVSKIAISPSSKTPTKIMIPFTMNKSPQRIAPAPITVTAASQMTSTSTSSSAIKPTTITMSPSKLIFRQAGPVTAMKGATLIGQPQVAGSSPSTQAPTSTVKQIAVPISAAGNVQPIQVPGSKFHYVRLVTTTVANSSGTRTATIVPVSASKVLAPATVATSVHHQPTTTPGQVKITLPIAPANQPSIAKVLPKTGISQQRILIPASSTSGVTQLRQAGNLTVASNMAPLPPGTALISTGANMQSFVMVPAQYVTQFQQQLNQSCATNAPATVTATIGSAPQPILPAQPTAQTHFVPIASAATAVNSLDTSQISQATRHHLNGRSTVEPNGVRPRKPCNCTKSQCLKLYCDCFANGEFCHNCNCSNCYNNLDHEEDRQKAIKACLDRNPLAFHPKIGKGKGCKGKDGEHERRHNKGCNCKRSGCLKNYCECYEAKIMCSNMCKCVGCKNFEESLERKTLMHLADAAEVRVQQQTAAKNKFSSQVQDVPSKPPIGTASGERLPFSFVTPEVVQATCQCLLARSEEGEKSGLSAAALERLVLEEFGRCLITIIDYANRTKAKPSPGGFDSASYGGLLRNSRASMLS